jgi:hypothetical protein
LLQFSQAISSPSGAVSTLIGLFSFAGPALEVFTDLKIGDIAGVALQA